MASTKYKGFIGKRPNSKLDVVVSSLRKENAYLKKTLVELSRQHSEHNKLVEQFLSLESARLESCQQLTAKDGTEPTKKEGKMADVVSMRRKRSLSSYSREIEEIKNELVSISTRCQGLENKGARKKDSDEWVSTNTSRELQNQLSDALKKNKQWLEYDQQREAYVKATLARMLWLEKLLNEANQARSQQHNEDHSVASVSLNTEREKISQMQEHYERLLQKAKDELRENLIMTQNWCTEKEREVEELKQQLQSDSGSGRNAPRDHHRSEDEEQWLSAETENLQCRLDEEKRRSANFELQKSLNRHHADQEEIADLERQIKISSQDLEDEKQNCVYLKKQMVKILKMLQKPKDHVKKQSKRDQQHHAWCEAAPPRSRDRSPTCSPPSGLLNESFLECPSCSAQYPARHYRELMSHLETCID